MDIQNKATRISLFNFSTKQMRAFHMSWFSFFLCFFAWFGIAPLMAIVRDELHLTKSQIGNTIIASVAITIVARLLIGWLCDRIGPRLCYTALLIFGSIPVMTIGFANSYETFLLFRLAIGAIGAAFVITQYHTSVMFAPNCVGTANATSAGWGNLGGGVTQMVMPMIFAGFVAIGYSDFWSWRLSMVVAGAVCMMTGGLYYTLTTDLPDGNFADLREQGKLRKKEAVKGTFAMAIKDKRVIGLFFIYAACFGIELTLNNIAALYYRDYFNLGLKAAGLVAGLFGLMNIFARTTGGIIGDKFGQKWGLKGRVKWLFIAIFIEGCALLVFSQMTILPLAIGTMIVFSLFVQMAEGATYSVVPFINKKALGSVSGIVGAGGNMGAVAAGFLFKGSMPWTQALFVLGLAVICTSFVALTIKFSDEDEKEAKIEYDKAVSDQAKIDEEYAKNHRPWAVPAFLKAIKPIDGIRFYLGIALAIKAIYFIVNFHEIEKLAGNIGHFQNMIAWYVVAVNGVGGICLALGFATRAAALLNISVLTGAVFFVHAGQGLFSADGNGLQFTLLILFTLVMLLWRGSGSFSLDSFFKQKTE